MNQRILTILAFGILAGTAPAQDKSTNAPSPFKNDQEKTGYAWGLMNGVNFKTLSVDFDLDIAARGLKDGFNGTPPLMTEQEAKEVMKKYSETLQARQAEKLKLVGAKNLKEGAAFLEQNKTKPGVIPLPSGLQYKVLVEGSGDSPGDNDTVTFNYRGMLMDETEFVNSSKLGLPPKAPLNSAGLPKGVAEALRLMKKGAKWKLFLTPALGNSERAQPGGPYGPNSTLIYEVELLNFSPPEPAATSVQPLVSDTIRVPSAEGIKNGEKIQTIKQEDLPKEIEKEKARQATNPPAGR